jgi:hypothetical protein
VTKTFLQNYQNGRIELSPKFFLPWIIHLKYNWRLDKFLSSVNLGLRPNLVTAKNLHFNTI